MAYVPSARTMQLFQQAKAGDRLAENLFYQQILPELLRRAHHARPSKDRGHTRTYLFEGLTIGVIKRTLAAEFVMDLETFIRATLVNCCQFRIDEFRRQVRHDKLCREFFGACRASPRTDDPPEKSLLLHETEAERAQLLRVLKVFIELLRSDDGYTAFMGLMQRPEGASVRRVGDALGVAETTLLYRAKRFEQALKELVGLWLRAIGPPGDELFGSVCPA